VKNGIVPKAEAEQILQGGAAWERQVNVSVIYLGQPIGELRRPRDERGGRHYGRALADAAGRVWVLILSIASVVNVKTRGRLG
jgi:hypothetical protein